MSNVLTDPGPGVAPGRIVQYLLNEGDLPIVRSLGGNMASAQAGEEYPAMIVKVWDDGVNLHVFVDGPKPYHRTSVRFSTPAEAVELIANGIKPSYEPGTWHWPVKV